MSWSDVAMAALAVFLLIGTRACERMEFRDDCEDFGAVKLGNSIYECRKLDGAAQ